MNIGQKNAFWVPGHLISPIVLYALWYIIYAFTFLISEEESERSTSGEFNEDNKTPTLNEPVEQNNEEKGN